MPTFRDLDVRHLEALVAVAEERTFGRAAARLGFTQSAVSQQVASLERLVEMPLFDRPKGPRPAELTPAGELLLEHARAVLARIDLAADDLDQLRTGAHGRLVVGTFQSVSAKLLPEIVGRLRADRPDLEIQLFEADDDKSLARRLLDNELDLTFLIDDEHEAGIDATFLALDPYVLLRRAHRSGPAGPQPMSGLDGAPLIGQPVGSLCQELVDRALATHRVSPKWVFRSMDNGAVQAMVRSGMGQAVMPYLAVEPDDPEIEVVDLDPPMPPRRITVARRAGRTLHPAADDFVRHARDVCAERVAERIAV